MARPITLTAPVRDSRQELMEHLKNAPAEHAEALLDAYELLQQLHDRKILELLRGTLAAGDKLVETAAHAADAPPTMAALRNLIIMGKALGSIDPEVTRAFAAAMTETMGAAKQDPDDQDKNPPSLLSLLGRLRRKESRRGMAFATRLLAALGRRLDNAPDSAADEKTR